ncbi:hypothetical protein PUNSTDRAFT_123958 [Punctularia strigosozonata HHB-11173 SS5]|uniref:uncharacterized protein n=1 Tax=Punctularia strigosozonata (strain HHB-11173) TaxID=741275 RepID=UPI00044184D9|nr:uncharacterized protein PUNSTDRAFT_123958 [Punctularia strigosozonata HHB-11173 SS5]EIN14393.1 hypothetical protein PUNSTDRAFT_123958 [Punctularia strigosozonata HHB-11173 SS5]
MSAQRKRETAVAPEKTDAREDPCAPPTAPAENESQWPQSETGYGRTDPASSTAVDGEGTRRWQMLRGRRRSIQCAYAYAFAPGAVAGETGGLLQMAGRQEARGRCNYGRAGETRVVRRLATLAWQAMSISRSDTAAQLAQPGAGCWWSRSSVATTACTGRRIDRDGYCADRPVGGTGGGRLIRGELGSGRVGRSSRGGCYRCPRGSTDIHITHHSHVLLPAATMLTVPVPPDRRDALAIVGARGRSRDVSPVAVARAVHERRRQPRQTPLPSHIPADRRPATTAKPLPIIRAAVDPSPRRASLSSSRSPSPSPVVVTPSEDPPATHTPMTQPLTQPAAHDQIWPPGSLSIQEQMQHAYALDNMHLARVLYLKLRGIEVSSDDDPRIAEVRDDDFQPCFVPPGAIQLEEEDERMLMERRREEAERWRLQEREERLRELGRRWDAEKAKMQAMKDRAAACRAKTEECKRRSGERDRKADARTRARDTRAQMDARTEETMRRHLQLGLGTSAARPKLSYDALSPARASPAARQEPYMLRYDLPPPIALARSTPAGASRSPPPCKPKPRRALTTPSPSPSPQRAHCIPFELVVTCMSGPLFPSEDPSCLRGRPSQRQLLDSLVKAGEHVASTKAKAPTRTPYAPRRTDSALSNVSTDSSDCPVCSANTSRQSTVSSASTSTSTSRSGSWLSFGSHMSVSTTITTPAASLRSKASSVSSSVSPRASPKVAFASLTIVHTCTCPRTRLTRVPLAECPLDYDDDEKAGLKELRAIKEEDGEPSRKRGSATLSFTKRVSLSMSRVVDFAARLQEAYVRATLSNAVAYDSYDSSRSSFASRSRGAAAPAPTKRGLKPPGYRVRGSDIRAFLSVPELAEPTDDEGDAPALYILLPLSSSYSPPAAQRPPTRALGLGPGYPPLPSPLRPRSPPPTLSYRERPIANPVMLRLKALQNVCCARALAWEGRGKDGYMGSGRERIVGVAFEGIGRSRLARQAHLELHAQVSEIDVDC